MLPFMMFMIFILGYVGCNFIALEIGPLVGNGTQIVYHDLSIKESNTRLRKVLQLRMICILNT